jgi:hypothetical protein
MSDDDTAAREVTDAMRHKLIADLFDLPVWERGSDRVVTPPWHTLTVAERDLLADALQQWKPDNGTGARP